MITSLILSFSVLFNVTGNHFQNFQLSQTIASTHVASKMGLDAPSGTSLCSLFLDSWRSGKQVPSWKKTFKNDFPFYYLVDELEVPVCC